MAIEQRTPFYGDQPIAAPVHCNNILISKNVNVPSERKQTKVWEQQQVPNLFSNNNIFVCFRDPIHFVRICRIGNYLRPESFIEPHRNGRCVRFDWYFVEHHPFFKAVDEWLDSGLKLSCAMISNGPLTQRVHQGPSPFQFMSNRN